jgi:hypothetical protein
VVPFQNCVLVTAAIKNVGPVCPTFLIAAVIKNENFINGQLPWLWYRICGDRIDNLISEF